MTDEAAAPVPNALRDRLPADPTLLAVLAVTALALLARLVALGSRTFHWDEGRVGYWVLRYVETGSFEYRPIIHGPFLQHVDRYLFEFLGATDFTARLPVAVVGGLLPLVAWLLRDHLRDEEVVGAALLLAANPLLLYYSRFMRSDVLVAAFSMFAFGFFVRTLDTGRRRHLYAGMAALALAFASKENALVYVGIWVGAAALLFDHRLFAAGVRDEDWLRVARTHLAGTARALWRWRVPALVALAEFVAIVVFLFAPRPALREALGDPAALPGVVRTATVGSWTGLWSQWVEGGLQGHSYVPFFTHYVETLAAGALAVTVLAAGGFLLDRYAGDAPRDVVAFAGYWGFVSILLYPLASDIQAAWTAVHAVAPLAIPASVALGFVYRVGRSAFDSDDRVGVGLAALVLLAIAAQVGSVAATEVYLHPQDRSQFVQYGQPEGDLEPMVADVAAVAARNDGPDVLFYGEHFHVPNETSVHTTPLVDGVGNWFHRMPLPWYLERHGVEPTSTTDPAVLEGDLPPVVMTRETDREAVEPWMDGYGERTYLITQDIPGNQVYLVVYVDEEALGGARAAGDPAG